MEVYVKLFLLALLTALTSAFLYWLERKTRFGKLKYWVRQVIYGIVFGLLAITGTELGVDVYGSATANIRDAAPLCAGFIFGAPAGIIAGIIGGVERWFSVLWGVGEYTRLACSVSTVIAGLYAAMLRLYICGNRRPSWLMGAAAGAVMEAFHLLLVLLTHPESLSRALELVRLLTLPMMLMTTAAIALSFFLVRLVRRTRDKSTRKRRISERMRWVVLVVFVICFLITTFLSVRTQIRMAEMDASNVMDLAEAGLEEDVYTNVDDSIVRAVKVIASTLDRNRNRSLAELAKNYDLAELHVVNRDGIITAGTDIGYIGFDLNSNEGGRTILESCAFSEIVNFSFSFGSVSFKGDGEEFERLYAVSPMKNGGFVLAGMDRETLSEMSVEMLCSLINNRRIQVDGYFMVCDENGRSPGVDESFPNDTITTITGLPEKIYRTTGVLHKTEIFAEPCYVKSTKYEGTYVISVLSVKEALESCYLSVYIIMFMQMIIYAVVYALVYKLLERTVVNPIKNVNESLGRITAGELDERVEERTSLEMDSLSEGINQTVDTLKQYITEAENRIEQELALAKDIQRSALPSVWPPYPNSHEYQIYAVMDPAKTVGGDFYDIFRQVGRRLVFIVADVSGKGIPAAMFMMTAKTLIKNLMESGKTPAEAFTEANDHLCEGNDAEMFVTAWMGVLEVLTGRLTFVNAGHNPPLLYKNGEGFSYLKSAPGFVLAGLPGIKYKEFEMMLQPGDKLFLYTDGAPEAVNPKLEQYGEKRLQAYLNAHSGEAPEQLIPALRADIERFTDGAEQFDDITMLELVYNGNTGE